MFSGGIKREHGQQWVNNEVVGSKNTNFLEHLHTAVSSVVPRDFLGILVHISIVYLSAWNHGTIIRTGITCKRILL